MTSPNPSPVAPPRVPAGESLADRRASLAERDPWPGFAEPPTTFAKLTASGSPREVGQAHGSTFATQVRACVDFYRQRFEHELKVPWAEALDYANGSVDNLRAADPGLADEMAGIAEGADLDLSEIVAINIRTGVTRMVEHRDDRKIAPIGGPEPLDHECTTAAILPEATADGHVLVAQNWDQRAACQRHTVLIEQHIEGEPALLFVTEAGILFRHGMNSAGLAIAGNSLHSDRESAPDQGLPTHLARRRALRHDNLADAREALATTPRSHSANHLLAAASGDAVDLEVVPSRAYAVDPVAGVLVHSNHFLSPEARAELRDRSLDLLPDSQFRDCRFRDAMMARHGEIGVGDLMSALRDHFGYPKSICRHADDPTSPQAGHTLSSSVWDLTQLRMWNAPGPTCVATFTEYGFSA